MISHYHPDTFNDIPKGAWLTFFGGIIGAGFAVGGVYWATHKQTNIAEQALIKAREHLELEQIKHSIEQQNKIEVASLTLIVSLEELQPRLGSCRSAVIPIFIRTRNRQQSFDDLDFFERTSRDIEKIINDRELIPINNLAQYISDIPSDIKSDLLNHINNERRVYLEELLELFWTCQSFIGASENQDHFFDELKKETQNVLKFIHAYQDQNREIIQRLRNLINI
jgi:hypothetical protein